MKKEETAVDYLINVYFGGIDNCTSDFRHYINMAKQIEVRKDKKRQLFIGKVAEIIGATKVVELLTECETAFNNK
jgi:hypothetical protein